MANDSVSANSDLQDYYGVYDEDDEDAAAALRLLITRSDDMCIGLLGPMCVYTFVVVQVSTAS